MSKNLSDGQSPNLEEALDCAKKAVELCNSIHSRSSMRSVDCYLNQAAILETMGLNEEAEEVMRECLEKFEEIDNSTARGTSASNEGSREASLLQKIGICFRERKDYQKSCELLERVL